MLTDARRAAGRLVAVAAIAAFAVLAVAASPARAQSGGQSTVLDPQERAAVEEIVRQYILDNPEIIVEAIEILQSREQALAADRQRRAIEERGDEIFDSATSPFIGNPDGDVVLVEFFDYNCGYCKRMLEPVQRLVEEDSGLKVVLKEFPILAPSSETAARAALAAREQGLYEPYHVALMAHRGSLDDTVIFALAVEVGLDVDRLRADMDAPEVAAEIEANLLLAQDLGVRGTPAFVIGDELIPGAVGYDGLRQAVEAERGS